MQMLRNAIRIKEAGCKVFVDYNTGESLTFDIEELTEAWFTMSNDKFFHYYGFNYIPSFTMQRKYKREHERSLDNEIRRRITSGL